MVTLRSVAAAVASVALFCHSSIAHSLKRNALDYVTVIDDAVIKTPSHRVHSHSTFDLTFALHDGSQKVRLVLEPNHDLLHESFSVTRLDSTGNVESIEPIPRTAHKVYKGQTFVQRPGRTDWENTGGARISILRDGDSPIFDGFFKIDGNGHHIHLGSRYRSLGHAEDPAIPSSVKTSDNEVMVVWRDSDIRGSGWEQNELKRDVSDNATTCGVGSLGNFDTSYDLRARDSNYQRAVNTRSLFGRQSVDDGGQGSGGGGTNVFQTIGSVDGCPSTRKIALVGIAVDCTYWEQNETEEDLRRHIIGMVSQASDVYENTFNISLGIRNITISSNKCPGEQSESAPWNLDCGGADMNERLSLFSGWRGQFTDINAYWTLLTKCATQTAVGLAWRGELCRQGSHQNPSDPTGDSNSSGGRTVSSTNVVVRTDTEWQIFAHETGHTFGAIHDCSDAPADCPVNQGNPQCCPLSTDSGSCNARGRFMMAPATGGGITSFSRCSIGNICSGLKNNIKANCLTDNRNVETVTGSQCGNGIVESGEDCDCGGDTGCKNNTCCDPKTCKYAKNAVCDPTNEGCCTKECKFAGTSTVCRESASDCDPEETCPGDSGHCPPDKHDDDGRSCGNGLQCASGQCTSRNLQCRNMFGTANNNARECPHDRSCMMTCASDDLSPNECNTDNRYFLDGTSCSAGGHCSNGRCEGTSTWKTIVQWLKDNKQISIPVGVVIAVLLLIAISSCILSCFRRRRRPAPKPPVTNNWPAYRAQPSQMFQNNNGNYGNYGNNTNYGNYGNYNNNNNNAHAPPVYTYSAVPNDQEQWNRSRSVRYA